MSELQTKVLWFPNGQVAAPEELDDFIRLTVRKGLDAKGNTIEIILENPMKEYDGTDVIHKYIEPDSKFIRIKPDDVIKIFVSHKDDQTDINTDSTDDLLTICDVIDIGIDTDSKKTQIKLSCIDKTYNMLNKVWTQAYGSTDAKNAPEIIKELIQSVSEVGESGKNSGYEQDADGVTGTFFNVNGMYEIDIRLESEGGDIQDERPDSSVYPDVSIGKLFKPVYEWIEELSSPAFCNTSTEIANATQVCQIKHVYYIDEENRFHWFYPTDSTDYTVSKVPSADGELRSLKLKNSVFDVVNCVFYSAGKGLANETVLGYYFDETSEEPKLKTKYIPYEHVALEMKNAEIANGNIDIAADGTTTFNVSSGTTAWGESFSTENDFTDKFFNEATKRASDIAQAYTQKRGSPRWKGTGRFKGKKYTPGRLMNITDYSVGLAGLGLRIKQVTHQVDRNNWLTTLDLEEDEKAKT